MPKTRSVPDRDELLADVAVMYYEDNLTQEEISTTVGISRSAISRILKEARSKGLVHIHVRRPARFDSDLENELIGHFNLIGAHVLTWKRDDQPDLLRDRLGQVAAQTLAQLLASESALGIAWGTTVTATVDAFEPAEPMPIKVVQLVGVLGSNSHAANAQVLVERMGRKLGGDSVCLYAPLIVETADIARSLLKNRNVRVAIDAARHCGIALLGVGTTDPETCSLYQGGHISAVDLDALRLAGAVGDVNAYYFDIMGRAVKLDLEGRVIGLPRGDLLKIPTRLGVAGGAAKAYAILGALRGGYINTLVTDSIAAQRILQLNAEASNLH